MLLECWHGWTAQERQRADKGGLSDQVSALHQKQHPWHMAFVVKWDERKRAETQRAPQEKDKRESVHGKVPTKYSTLSSLQTLVMTVQRFTATLYIKASETCCPNIQASWLFTPVLSIC
eukprot:1157497-Pelagomonas_calceolata.AAC.11